MRKYITPTQIDGLQNNLSRHFQKCMKNRLEETKERWQPNTTWDPKLNPAAEKGN
jgi:hypothetical protein